MTAVVTQVTLLRDGLIIHKQRAPENLMPFQSHMEQRFFQMCTMIEQEYGIKVCVGNTVVGCNIKHKASSTRFRRVPWESRFRMYTSELSYAVLCAHDRPGSCCQGSPHDPYHHPVMWFTLTACPGPSDLCPATWTPDLSSLLGVSKLGATVCQSNAIFGCQNNYEVSDMYNVEVQSITW